MTLALILLASLYVMTTAVFTYLLLRESRSSKNPSPTPISMPPMPSEDPTLTMVRMMTTTMQNMAKENRELMETLMLGRTQTSQPASSMSLPEEPTSYDYDSTPLSPGIEAVISRELEEDQQEVFLKERAALQLRLAELQAEEMSKLAQEGAADSLPGPWMAQAAESENRT